MNLLFYSIEGTEETCIDQLQVLEEEFSDQNQACENSESKFLLNNGINKNEFAVFSLQIFQERLQVNITFHPWPL